MGIRSCWFITMDDPIPITHIYFNYCWHIELISAALEKHLNLKFVFTNSAIVFPIKDFSVSV